MAADTTAMRDLLDYLAKELAGNPDVVKVTEAFDGEDSVTFNVHADREDLGRLIGRNGKTAKSIRHLVGLIAADQGCRVGVEFVE